MHATTTRSSAAQTATRGPAVARKRPLKGLSLRVAWLIALATVLPASTHAADGCTVLMCLAAPSWSSIPQCVPPVQQVLNDLSHGRPFPTCSSSGTGTGGVSQWSDPPSYCPPQYTHVDYLESGVRYTCDFDGAVAVAVNGALWSRTWWNESGGSVTEFTAAAKAQLGTWDTRFDDDYAAWLAARPPTAPTNDSSGG